MKKFLIIASVLIIASCGIGAGENSDIINRKTGFFPKLTGIDLEGEKRRLPKSFNNKINLVVIAFHRDQQDDVDDWVEEADEIMKKYPEVGFYEIPLIYELDPFSRTFINNGMRRGVVDPIARKRTITVYTDREKFLKIMNMKDDRIYLLVVAKNGKIMQRIEGDATNENISSLKKKWSF